MSNSLRFTPAQLSVLNSTDKNLLVSASAGTGKTTVMVEKIKGLVEQKGAQIDRMLIVTFTKLSALEMKEKLFESLSASDNPLSEEQCSKIDQCSIGTIHSFCADVIREYFYVVGIDPNFSVLSDAESAQLFERAVESVFDKRYREGEEMLDVVEKFCGERDDVTLRLNVGKLHSFGGGVESLSEWFEERLEFFDDEKIRDYFNTKLLEKNRLLKEWVDDLIQRMGEVGADSVVERLDIMRDLLCATDKVDLFKNVEWLSEAKIPARPKNFEEDAIFYCDEDEKKKLLEELALAEKEEKALFNYAKELAEALLCSGAEEVVKQFCRYNVALAEEVEKVFNKLKREKNVVDFSDMEKMTLEILRDGNSAQQIKNRYDYVFVDEYQDVNGIQEKILRMVSKPNALFAVGDVKQSIYGFRQACPEIFVERVGQYEQDERNNEVVYMNHNFRCNKDIADFVNLTFMNAMTDSFGMVDYERTGMLFSTREVCLLDGKHPVEVVRIDNSQKKSEQPKEIYDLTDSGEENLSDGRAEGEYVAKRIKELMATPREDGTRLSYSDIVVLRRSVKSDAVDLYKQLLRAGIPAVIKLDGEDNYKEINDIIAFFKVLDNKYDDYSVATLLTGPIGKMDFNHLARLAKGSAKTYLWQKVCDFSQRDEGVASDQRDKEVLQKCRDLMALTKKYETISSVVRLGRLLLQLFEETEYEKFVLTLPNGLLRRERLMAFCGQVSGLTLAEFLKTPLDREALAMAGVAGDAVRIMTIHVSKGLEFDVVFLSGLDTAFSKKRKGNLIMHQQCGMASVMSNEGMSVQSLRQKFVSEFSWRKQKEEELRLFYVGTTRAKRKLICVSVDEYQPKSPYFVAEDANKMQDWLPDEFVAKRGFFQFEKVSASDLFGDSRDKVVCSDQPRQPSAECLQRCREAIEWQYPHKQWLDLPLKVVSSKLDGESLYKNKNFLQQENFAEEREEAFVLTALSAEEDGKERDKTELGKAYHKIFETCNVREPSKRNLQETLEQLLKEGWIEQKIAQQVDLSLVYGVLQGKAFRDIVKGGKIYREKPFLTVLPYNQLFGEGSDKEIMLQGVIDMLVVKEDCAVVVDFKVTGNSDSIKRRYQKQLNSYALAVQKCLKLPVKACVLSVLDGRIIDFDE